MRKILTREERERKEMMNRVIVGLVLVVIMILSTIGYSFYYTGKSNVKKIEYSGIEFILKEDDLWHFEINQYEFATVHNPKETENITSFITSNLLSYQGKPLYFSYDSERKGTEEIIRSIGRFVARIQYVCLDECEGDLPIKNCSENIIIIKEAGENLIKQEDNCVYVLAKEGDILKVSDAFIFRILGLKNG